MSTPQSTINICSGVRLNNRYEHSIYFSSPAAQKEYFAGYVTKTYSAYSYLRKTWPLQVEATMEQAKTWTYLFFQNGTGKTYYYFINQVEYKNDNMVELTLELDVLQTYLFDFRLLDCFVERQHTETDNLGEYTLDEGLELGELKDMNVVDLTAWNDLCILVLSTFNPNHSDTTKPVDSLGYMYDNVFSGLTIWAVDSKDWAKWSDKLTDLSAAGFIDGIISMWMYPKNCVVLGGEQEWDDESLCKVVKSSLAQIAGYKTWGEKVPEYKNNKLLCYPYNFLYVTNNQGGSAAYRFERFKDFEPVFEIQGALSPDGSMKIVPRYYNGATETNYDQGLTLGGFPSCAWDADVYKLWLAQNQNQQQHARDTAGLTIAAGAVTAGVSLAMGNVAGAAGGVAGVIGGAQQIAALNAQKADMSIQPPQSRGAFSSNVNAAAKKLTFSLYHKGVTPEYGKIIDQYFTMYGYKLHEVRKPNLAARSAFTYVKTVGCHIEGFMCNEDITKIEAIFDKGITWWRNTVEIGDYSADNVCIGGA